AWISQQSLSDQEALLLSTGYLSNRRISKSSGIDLFQRLINHRSSLAAGPTNSPVMPIQAKTNEITRSQRQLRFKSPMLWRIADSGITSVRRFSQHTYRASTRL